MNHSQADISWINYCSAANSPSAKYLRFHPGNPLGIPPIIFFWRISYDNCFGYFLRIPPGIIFRAPSGFPPTWDSYWNSSGVPFQNFSTDFSIKFSRNSSRKSFRNYSRNICKKFFKAYFPKFFQNFRQKNLKGFLQKHVQIILQDVL